MSLERITRKLNANFTTISNQILRDATISLKAKALHITVMSLPPDWDFSVRGIATIIKEGRDAIYSGLLELEAAGYIERSEIRESGRFVGTQYTFLQESPCTEKPYTENPDTVKPDTENPPQIRTKEIKTERIKNSLNQSESAFGLGLPVNLESTARIEEFMAVIRETYNAAVIPNERRWAEAAIKADTAGITPAELAAMLRKRLDEPDRKFPVTPESVLAAVIDDKARGAKPKWKPWKQEQTAPWTIEEAVALRRQLAAEGKLAA